MTKREFEEQLRMFRALEDAGIDYDDRYDLQCISRRLRSWFERECGTDNGSIERDETSQKPYWRNAQTGNRYPIRDMETGARKRLAFIMSKYPTLKPYIQEDCRGAALYILRPNDMPPEGGNECMDSYYTRGICVY